MPQACRSHAAGPRSKLSVADLLIRHADACLRRFGDDLRAEERKALQSIHLCRTPAMGGRGYRCAHCERDHYAYHSCNHRLCPVCGAAETKDWVAAQLERRLPVGHFLVTFTLPSQLRPLCRREARRFLSASFAASSQALKDVLKDPRHLGGDCGMTGVLQTWTQDLRLHPHIHYIVPAVGIDAKGKLKRPRKAGWLARGEVLASRMRALLLRRLEREGLLSKSDARPLWDIKWNCDVEDFGDGSNAIRYLGGYLERGPISDSRIRGETSGSILIAVKDRETDRERVVAIGKADFVRRYLQHALPQGFHAVRRYGFLHPRAKAKLEAIRERLGVRLQAAKSDGRPAEPSPPPLCPRCRKPMEMTAKLSRAPPWERTVPKIWARRDRRAAA